VCDHQGHGVMPVLLLDNETETHRLRRLRHTFALL
jgi:hypothetical protein